MRPLELTIGTRHFYLAGETNLGELERAIEEAARVGGGMIEIPGLQQHRVWALITPSTPVFLEHVDPADVGRDDHDGLTSSSDYDLQGSLSGWDA
ncbi:MULTISPECIES: hypothetical protein [unclassified Rathayibacter]|uniref:hypothetical protein n=1 Tax=unclassified Rathayibacter TaxID=2609250 RepID=UPI000CE8193F|nr:MULTISPECIES: hypothetical protein [unclassified Rathayibacter]PPH53758.1 hypothetical protein C5C49_04390 [Rathayibacter sp. AY1E2]PPI06415.1 hypothetical protein C5C63_10170 [Rathayibacter sp. AY1B8]PPI18889.1 hypothetical protein C5D04_00320 [Rathayibacter sp. AY1D2]